MCRLRSEASTSIIRVRSQPPSRRLVHSCQPPPPPTALHVPSPLLARCSWVSSSSINKTKRSLDMRRRTQFYGSREIAFGGKDAEGSWEFSRSCCTQRCNTGTVVGPSLWNDSAMSVTVGRSGHTASLLHWWFGTSQSSRRLGVRFPAKGKFSSPPPHRGIYTGSGGPDNVFGWGTMLQVKGRGSDSRWGHLYFRFI
jgi:hypothetical protein